ncbi:MAG: 4-hydroxy-tetrahydrodipicolinate synthase [Candidatus Caenarcaniphilales bacterium]|nr:4-hydroxy-tetrahydrodipicolinate synthase [Candidatus Caenarcaniphilales bacterium]
MFSSQFGQLITAMVTPFREDGEIDYAALEKLLEHLIKTGSQAVLITGTTGENPTLTHDEEWELLRTSKEIIKGRIPIVFGAGSNSTKTAVATSLKAQEEGAAAVMSVCPYYNKPNQSGMFEHFSAVASAIKLPVMLYNNPGRTCISIEPDTIASLNKKHSNICCIKESSGSLDPIALIKIKAPGVEVYCGDDNLTLPSLAVGAKGVVSVASHVVGREISTLIENILSGKVQEAAKIHIQLFPLFKALFSSPSPGPVKYLLSQLGICKPYLRLPLTEPAEEVRNTLNKLLNEIVAHKD